MIGRFFEAERRQKGEKLRLFWDGLEAGRGAENQPPDKEGSSIRYVLCLKSFIP